MSGLFIPAKGAALLVPSGPHHDPGRKHLFVIVTDWSAAEGWVLLVGLRSYREGRPYDPTCFLYPGDHPFIRHASFVNYRQAYVVEAQKLADRVNRGIYIRQPGVDGLLCARIAQGVLTSRQTPQKVKAFYRTAANTGE